MLKKLYYEVYGHHDDPPTKEQLQQLAMAMAGLPFSIASFFVHHYLWKKSMEQIAAETGSPLHLQERWKMAGIAILQLWLCQHENNSVLPAKG